ncbi:hypothetical protein IC582_018560 [Cucumis melo]
MDAIEQDSGGQNWLWKYNTSLLRDYVQHRCSCFDQSPEYTIQATLNFLCCHFQALQSFLSNLRLLNLHFFNNRAQSHIHILKFVQSTV